MKITPKQEDVLSSLATFGGRAREWARPMDIGAFDGSHHTATLRVLIDKKLVERRLRGSLLNQIRGQETYDALAKMKKRGRSAPRGSYTYRLTKRGWKVARP
jgi:hypothetical protein